jgi:hypothetical protein
MKFNEISETFIGYLYVHWGFMHIKCRFPYIYLGFKSTTVDSLTSKQVLRKLL